MGLGKYSCCLLREIYDPVRHAESLRAESLDRFPAFWSEPSDGLIGSHRSEWGLRCRQRVRSSKTLNPHHDARSFTESILVASTRSPPPTTTANALPQSRSEPVVLECDKRTHASAVQASGRALDDIPKALHM
jgi:hypothetical protein